MENQEKKTKVLWVVAIIAVILIVVGVVFVLIRNGNDATSRGDALYTEAEDGTKTNVSKKLSEAKLVEGLKIENIELTSKEEVSYLKAQVKNTNKEKSGDFNINIKLVDENGQEIITIVGYIPSVEAGQTTILDTAVTTDVAGAYNFEVSKVSE